VNGSLTGREFALVHQPPTSSSSSSPRHFLWSSPPLSAAAAACRRLSITPSDADSVRMSRQRSFTRTLGSGCICCCSHWINLWSPYV